MPRKTTRKEVVEVERPVRVGDILNMDSADFRALAKDERRLRSYVQKLADAGNKRLKRFLAIDEESPAVIGVRETGGRFTTKGKSREELKREFMRIKDFYQSETGNLRSWRRVKEQTLETIEKDTGVELDENLWNKTWKAYEEIKSGNPWVKNKEYKYKLLDIIQNIAISDGRTTGASIARRLERQTDGESALDRFYKSQIEGTKDRGTSQFFNTESESDT